MKHHICQWKAVHYGLHYHVSDLIKIKYSQALILHDLPNKDRSEIDTLEKTGNQYLGSQQLLLAYYQSRVLFYCY